MQSLILADYTSLVPFTLEAMLLYIYGEYHRSRDAQPAIFALMGMVVRLAQKMGYHREPSYASKIPPFEAEMRRRLWLLVCHTDMLFASQHGFPSFIRGEQSDTRLPRNLLDEDMYPDMPELPASRPMTDPTPVGSLIAKDGMIRVYRRIVEYLAAVGPKFVSKRVLALDQELQEARNEIPLYLRMRSMDQSIADSSELIIRRMYLEFNYQKGRCTLHRQYLTQPQLRLQHPYSRMTCIEAALQLLNHQSTLHEETQPGGQLQHYRGSVSEFTNNFFLTAAMIICLELSYVDEQRDEKQTGDLLAALDRSRRIWCEESAQSHAARKVADALEMFLKKARGSHVQRSRSSVDAFSVSSSVQAKSIEFHGLETSAAGSNAKSSNTDGSNSNDSFGPQSSVGSGLTTMTWEDMLQMPMDIDWVR